MHPSLFFFVPSPLIACGRAPPSRNTSTIRLLAVHVVEIIGKPNGESVSQSVICRSIPLHLDTRLVAPVQIDTCYLS